MECKLFFSMPFKSYNFQLLLLDIYPFGVPWSGDLLFQYSVLLILKHFWVAACESFHQKVW